MIKIVKPQTDSQKATRTTQDSWLLSPDEIKALKLPPFQRPLTVNAKVKAIADELKAGRDEDGNAIISGQFCIGYLDGERYLVDGQHRREAFLISGVQPRVHRREDPPLREHGRDGCGVRPAQLADRQHEAR